MNFAIVFSPNAEKDLQEICEYYKNISSKINEKFLENVEIRQKNCLILPWQQQLDMQIFDVLV